MKKRIAGRIFIVIGLLITFLLPSLGYADAPEVASMQTQGPKIVVSPKSVNCGTVKAGDISGCKAVTVKNTGTSPLIIYALSITGNNATEFAQMNDCTNVATGGFCTINILFSPEIPFGKKTAVLNITSNDPKKPGVSVKLSGKAPPPIISVSPKSVNGGSVKVGSTAGKSVTVKNTGTSDLIIDSIVLGGAHAGEFAMTHDCSVLAKGGTCGISVTFTPVSIGKKSAAVSIVSNDPKKSTVTVKLSGKGISVDGGKDGAKATVNVWTSEKVIGLTILGQQITDISRDFDVFDMENETEGEKDEPLLNLAKRMLAFLKPYIGKPVAPIHGAGSESGKEFCDDGGTFSYSLSWDGPRYPEECDEVRNAKLTAKFKNCEADDVLMNGTLYIGFVGDMCQPSAMTIKFTSFSLHDTYGDLSFQSSKLELVFTELVWSYETIRHLKVVLNGDVKAWYDGYNYSADFKNFYSIIDADRDNNFTLIVGGSLRGGCMDGWGTLDTLEPILMNSKQYCPKGGKMRIIGNGEMIVDFYGDGSLSISGQHYSSCRDLDTTCTR